MPARASACPAQARSEAPPPLDPAALVFLRGADADGRLAGLVATRRTLRPVLGSLASEILRRHAFEPLGFRSLGDYARERLGVTSRVVREWARVWELLVGLPHLRAGVLSGDVSWSAARRAVAHVAPESDADCAADLRGRTVKAVDAMLRAAVPADEQAAQCESEERVRITLHLARDDAPRWHGAVELARRVAGEALPVWECAEMMAAEALSALPREVIALSAPPDGPEASGAGASACEGPRRSEARARAPDGAALAGTGASARDDTQLAAAPAPARATPAVAASAREHGLRHEAFPLVRWRRAAATSVDASATDPPRDVSPHGLDAAMRRAVRDLQRIDHDLGLILRQIADRRLYHELGFPSFDRYVEERADVSPRTARRWVHLARVGAAAPAVSRAIRSGKISSLQAALVARASSPATAPAWVARARAVTVRRLEEDVAEACKNDTVIAFTAPCGAASVFLHAVAATKLQLTRQHAARPSTASAVSWIVGHAIACWLEHGAQFRDYADFERDRFRCTVPGCTARRNLESHHIVFRSAHGADEPRNRTTLCAFHHRRGLHAHTLSICGRAPDGLEFRLGLRGGAAPLLVAVSGDLLRTRRGREP